MIEYFIIGIAIAVMLFSVIDIWQSSIQIRRLTSQGKDMLKYQWLIQMGMVEQATYFNSFGLQMKDHGSFMQ